MREAPCVLKFSYESYININEFFFPYDSNESSQQVPHFLNSKIISGLIIPDSNKSFNGQVTIRLEHTQVDISSVLQVFLTNSSVDTV